MPEGHELVPPGVGLHHRMLARMFETSLGVEATHGTYARDREGPRLVFSGNAPYGPTRGVWRPGVHKARGPRFHRRCERLPTVR